MTIGDSTYEIDPKALSRLSSMVDTTGWKELEAWANQAVTDIAMVNLNRNLTAEDHAANYTRASIFRFLAKDFRDQIKEAVSQIQKNEKSV